MTPLLIFQRLSIEWGREGRTAALTARRRELPRQYPLPPSPLPAGMVALAQNVEWTDADGFTHATETVWPYTRLDGLGGTGLDVTATPDADTLELLPAPHLGGFGPGGMGGRLRLRPGQLARYEWNERLGEAFGAEGRVRHTVVSVSLCRRPLPDGVLSKVPDFYVSHLIDLSDRRWRAGRAG